MTHLRLTAVAVAATVALAACGGGPPPADLTAAPAQATISSALADSLLRQGEAQFRSGKWADAVTTLERLNLELPAGDARLPGIRFRVGEAQLAQGMHLEAARQFRRVSDEFPGHPLAADALLRVGDAYAELWRRPELDPSYGQTALATYQELINRYPGGSPAVRARAKVTALQEKLAVKEFKAALYYLRLKAYDSAILYLKDLVASYPRSSVAPQALVRLVRAYRVLGYEEDVRETCGYLERFHPGSAGADDCPAAPGRS